jgi:hypothetical protein
MDGLFWHIIFSKCSLPQMPSRTRGQDGAGTSRGRETTPNPPPVPPTLAEAIATLVNATADNTRFLREMAGQQMQQQGGRAYPQGPRETSYLDFSETRPPLFVKAEDPLEADEWIRIIEQNLGFSDARRLKIPYLRHSICEALPAPGGEIMWLSSLLVIKLPGTNSNWLVGSTIFLKGCSIRNRKNL